MREDMRHVLIDRPRWNPTGDSYRQARRRNQDPENSPAKESMEGAYRNGYNRKQFNDHVQPLLRYLVSQIGRPWDKVYSEIREQVSPGSTIQLHLLQHVDQCVHRKVVIRDGKVLDLKQRYIDGELVSRGKHPTMYVHPENGLLCAAKRKNESKEQVEISVITFPDNPRVQLRKYNGKWHRLLLAKIPDPVVTPLLDLDGEPTGKTRSRIPATDRWLRCPIETYPASTFRSMYGEGLYCYRVESVNSKEMKIVRNLGGC